MPEQPEIEGVVLTPLRIIELQTGDVLHGMKASSQGFAGFGEVYFSTVEPGAIKAWKRHREMTLNLVVPVGQVRFVLFDDRPDSITQNKYQEVMLSRNNYYRLTVPPMLWIGFQGMTDYISLVMNVANIEHSSKEEDRLAETAFYFDWGY